MTATGSTGLAMTGGAAWRTGHFSRALSLRLPPTGLADGFGRKKRRPTARHRAARSGSDTERRFTPGKLVPRLRSRKARDAPIWSKLGGCPGDRPGWPIHQVEHGPTLGSAAT